LSVGLESKPKRKIVKLKMIMSGTITPANYLFLKSIAMEQRWGLTIPRPGDPLSDVLPKHFVSGISMKEKKTSTVLIKIMASK